MNGLVGAKNGRGGGPGQANLRKRKKTNGLVWLKTGSAAGQPKENEKMNGLVRGY